MEPGRSISAEANEEGEDQSFLSSSKFAQDVFQLMDENKLSDREYLWLSNSIQSADTLNATTILENIAFAEGKAIEGALDTMSVNHLKELNPRLFDQTRRLFLQGSRTVQRKEQEALQFTSAVWTSNETPEYLTGGGVGKWRDNYFEDYKEGENPQDDPVFNSSILTSTNAHGRQLISDVEIIQLKIGPLWSLDPLYVSELMFKINWEKRTISYDLLCFATASFVKGTGNERQWFTENLKNFCQSLRKKIEYSFDDIEAIRITSPILSLSKDTIPQIVDLYNNEVAVQIELKKAPSFFQKVNKSPNGQPNPWKPCDDFTDGVASKYCKHFLFFPADSLDKKLGPKRNRMILAKLLEREPRLNKISLPSNVDIFFLQPPLPKSAVQKRDIRESNNSNSNNATDEDHQAKAQKNTS